MSSEIQLVLIGGLIAILSSISTAVFTALLGYWLENRRERQKLKIEAGRALGRLAGFSTAESDEDESWMEEHKEILKKIRTHDNSLEQLAGLQGFIDTFIETTNRQREKEKAQEAGEENK